MRGRRRPGAAARDRGGRGVGLDDGRRPGRARPPARGRRGGRALRDREATAVTTLRGRPGATVREGDGEDLPPRAGCARSRPRPRPRTSGPDVARAGRAPRRAYRDTWPRCRAVRQRERFGAQLGQRLLRLPERARARVDLAGVLTGGRGVRPLRPGHARQRRAATRRPSASGAASLTTRPGPRLVRARLRRRPDGPVRRRCARAVWASWLWTLLVGAALAILGAIGGS